MPEEEPVFHVYIIPKARSTREGDLLRNEIARHALGPLSCRDDGTHAGGIVDEFEEVGFLRRVCVVNDKPRGDLPPVGVEDVACFRTAYAPPPRDHLPTVAIVTEQFDNAFHAHLASTVVFPVIVSPCGHLQCRFQFSIAAALLVLA